LLTEANSSSRLIFLLVSEQADAKHATEGVSTFKKQKKA
jgi:hypothetical protein